MMTLENTFRVAIFDEFLDAFARIPRAQQKKVNKFVRLFREDPTSASINYEAIHTFVDPNLRTVRIDQAYRAIVLRPQQGNVYVLLWVDHHDEAMRWAENKRVSIHPETGGLQVISGVTVELSTPAPAERHAPPLFEGVRDRELLRLGVPEDHVEQVRAIRTPLQLEELRGVLPPEAHEALFWLAEGESLQDVETAMAVKAEPSVDPTDFEAALDRETSRRRFVTVDDDAALEAMLDAPLEKWRIFLHPSQRQLVDRSWNGPVRVLGGAGTGKTVVAMHRAVHLVEKVFTQPDDRVLFTTFTRNLAADIDANLAKLTGPETKRRIEVTHLDRFVGDLLKRAGYAYEIAWWGMGNQLEGLWEQAMGLAPPGAFAPSFYRDEWELVVQPAGCASAEDYRAASRSGRGVRMSRAQKKDVWPVFEEYRNLLEKHGLREPEDALRDAASLLESGRARAGYRAVVVDEAQDMSTHAFALLRRVVPEGRDDLFLVGDGHQRIYRKRVVLGRAGVNIVGRGKRLRINYRTTDEIRRFAVALLEGVEVDDLDQGTDTTQGYRSLMHGDPPDVQSYPTFDDEVAGIVAWLGDGDLARTCLVARTNALRDQYEAALNAAGIGTHAVHRSQADDPSKSGLRVATMHRVKGLEFDRMVIAGVNDDLMPWRRAVERSDDAAVKREAEEMERALFYVAVTRAKRAALITSYGEPSALLAGGSTKTCPKCGRTGTVESLFGTRNVKHTRADGTEVVSERPQSYCRDCR